MKARHNAFVEVGRYGIDHLHGYAGLGRGGTLILVPKLLAQDATMCYATKITERSTRGKHCGAARRLQVFTRPIPFAADFGFEPFWTPVRLMP